MSAYPKRPNTTWKIVYLCIFLLLLSAVGGVFLWKKSNKPPSQPKVFTQKASSQKRGDLIRLPMQGSVTLFHGSKDKEGFFEVLDFETKMAQMANDPNVQGVFLDMALEGLTMTHVEQLIHVMEDFKRTSQKPIFAYAEHMDLLSWVLVSHADRLFLEYGGYIEKGYIFSLNMLPELPETAEESIKQRHPILYPFGRGKGLELHPFFPFSHPSQEAMDERDVYYTALKLELIKELFHLASTQRKQPDLHLFNRLEEGCLTAYMALEEGWVDQLVQSKEQTLLTLKENNNYKQVTTYEVLIDPPQFSSFTAEDAALIVCEGELWSDETAIDQLSVLCDQLLEAKCQKVTCYFDSVATTIHIASKLFPKFIDHIKQKGLQVRGILGPKCLSTGVWMASQWQQIDSYSTTLTGGIGITTPFLYLDFPQGNTQWELESYIVNHLLFQNEKTRYGVPIIYHPLSKQEQEKIKQEVDEAYNDMVKCLKKQASSRGETFDETYANGRMHPASAGLKAHYIKQFIHSPLLQHIKKGWNINGQVYPFRFRPTQK